MFTEHLVRNFYVVLRIRNGVLFCFVLFCFVLFPVKRCAMLTFTQSNGSTSCISMHADHHFHILFYHDNLVVFMFLIHELSLSLSVSLSLSLSLSFLQLTFMCVLLCVRIYVVLYYMCNNRCVHGKKVQLVTFVQLAIQLGCFLQSFCQAFCNIQTLRYYESSMCGMRRQEMIMLHATYCVTV